MLFWLTLVQTLSVSDSVKFFGLHGVAYERPISSSVLICPESLSWDRSGRRLGLLLDRGPSSAALLFLWPSGKQINLPRLGDFRYVHWARNGRQVAVGDGEQAIVVDSSSRKAIKRVHGVLDAAWRNGGWQFARGTWPDIDDLPGTTGSGRVKKIGTRLPMTVDVGAGCIALRVSDKGFIPEYLAHNSRGHRWLPIGSPLLEVDQRPFCVSMNSSTLIGIPMRAIGGYQLFEYDEASVKPYTFGNWRDYQSAYASTGDQVVLSTLPELVNGHVFAYGFPLGDSGVKNKTVSALLDFTDRRIYNLTVPVLSATATARQREIAVIAETQNRKASPAGKVLLVAR